ncbi:conjugal transfer protein TraG N-terminal domain-containing protein [Vibrio sp. Y2-5]|uniref:conjugal transfer protein TraG N-terminal domain-containing protein n=1 Tax=Vibrio sp. Y2-5 TaxID=2743977 RepID=UPI001660B891|nr:conjugal transfer protein TraG N-terminal domain-containing protein [Vibrio sp. Y2-5]MBD0788213.1 conjugal transfer protein TraG N-terminal domain-containing protein [Vibrio sp. Y2-5]
MLNVSEITGAWLIPYGISLGNNFWAVINETGLFLIPFSLVLCTSFLKARSQGADEGSPAVLFIKILEKRWIGMFMCMYLFVMPWSVDHTNLPATISSEGQIVHFTPINFKGYSCRKYESSILGENASVANVKPNLPFTEKLNYNLPVLFGVANQMVQAFTQSLNAEIPCDPDMNPTALLGKTVAFSTNGDTDMTYTVKSFVDQCYFRALSALGDGITYGQYNEGVPLTENEKYMTSNQLLKAYGGGLTTKSGSNSEELHMTYDSDLWVASTASDNLPVSKSIDGDSHENKAINCTEAARSIYSVIVSKLKKDYTDEMRVALTTNSAYPNRDGTADDDDSIYAKYAQQYLMDAYGNVSAFMDIYYEMNSGMYAKVDSDMVGEAVSRITTLSKQLEGNVQNYLISLSAPIIISALIAALYACSPILLTLSAYSFRLAVTLVYTLVFLIGTSYVLDLGWYIENVVLAVADSYYGVYGGETGTSSVWSTLTSMIPVIQTFIVPTMLTIWSVFGAMLGVTIIPGISQFVNQMTGAAASAGVAITAGAIKLLAKMMI